MCGTNHLELSVLSLVLIVCLQRLGIAYTIQCYGVKFCYKMIQAEIVAHISSSTFDEVYLIGLCDN